VGKLRSDPTIAMRVHLAEPPKAPASRLALYLRGTSFDRYDGASWTRTRPVLEPAAQEGSHVWIAGRPLGAVAMTIDLEPINPPIVFLPADAVGFSVNEPSEVLAMRGPKISVAEDGEYRYERGDERGLTYSVYRGRYRQERLSVADRARYSTVSEDIKLPLSILARKWVGSLSQDWEMADAVEERLRSEYRYDLNSPSGGYKQPLLHFLETSKAGHCEFYSTAMAMLLRTLEVPTRNVTGFIGGTYNRFGEFYAVRQGDAHSWVEVYLEGRGWTRYDPTPPLSSAPRSDVTGMVAFMRDVIEAAAQRWSRHVIGYDLDQQVELFRSVKERYRNWGGLGVWRQLRPFIPPLVVLGLGAAAYFVWRRLRLGRRRVHPAKLGGQPAKVTRVVALYRSLEDVLGTLGIARQPTTPPLAHARALAQLKHPAALEVLSLTECYLEARFGGRELSAEEERAFELRVKALRQLRLPEDRAA
jgi:transglutaminase-like putative cysteine protease